MKSEPNCFWSNLFVSENPTSNNSFQILINFSLVFKISPKVCVRRIPLQHKLELLVSHFFWREMCDVICNLPIDDLAEAKGCRHKNPQLMIAEALRVKVSLVTFALLYCFVLSFF